MRTGHSSEGLDEAAETLNFGRPIAIMILMTLQYISDADNPHQIVKTLVDAVPAGSYLAISDVAMDLEADAHVVASADNLNEKLKTTQRTRDGGTGPGAIASVAA